MSAELDLVRQLVLGEELYGKCKSGGKVSEDEMKKRLNDLVGAQSAGSKFVCTVKDMANLCDMKNTNIDPDTCEFSSLNILKQTAELFTKKKFILGNGLTQGQIDAIKNANTLKEALTGIVDYLKSNFDNMDILISKEKGILYLLIDENDSDVWIDFFETLKDVLVADARKSGDRATKREKAQEATASSLTFLRNIINYQINHSKGDDKNIKELKEYLDAADEHFAEWGTLQ